MDIEIWKNLYHNYDLPIVVCENTDEASIVYLNDLAIVTATQFGNYTFDKHANNDLTYFDFFRTNDNTIVNNIFKITRENGSTESFPVIIENEIGRNFRINLAGSTVSIDNKEYLVFFVKSEDAVTFDEGKFYRIMNFIFELTHLAENANYAIQSVLDVCGSITSTSRAYIIESISDKLCRNTYEWCNYEIEPMKNFLKNIDKSTYGYYDLIQGPGSIIEDISTIKNPNEREILELQGIKSMVTFPIITHGQAIGFIGFDDCINHHKWDYFELRILREVASILASLIKRREEERKSEISLTMLEKLADGIDSPILVNSLDTYEVLFANKRMLDSINIYPEFNFDTLVGQTCYKLLSPGSNAPCPDCPLDKFKNEYGEYEIGSLSREFKADYTDQWFLVRDSIVEWDDGSLVHLESSLEITKQKKTEEILQDWASTDSMTGTYNRAWGIDLINDLINNSDEDELKDYSLIFIDLDHLKNVNDSLGHQQGDNMIIKLVNIIQSTICPEDFIIRWGGDEFIIVLHSPISFAKAIIDKISESVEIFNEEHTKDYYLGFSYGITNFLENSTKDLKEIIEKADKNMYKHKQKKKLGE